MTLGSAIKKVEVSTYLDVGFKLVGSTLPHRYPSLLRDSIKSLAPWTAEDTKIGIRISGLNLKDDESTPQKLTSRSQLWLRLPAALLEYALQLSDQELKFAQQHIRLVSPKVKQLIPHPTIYAHRVVSACHNIAEFESEIDAILRSLDINAEIICGREGSIWEANKRYKTFSLMLHRLSSEHSISIQSKGIGAYRTLGCGLFIPHRSAYAV